MNKIKKLARLAISYYYITIPLLAAVFCIGTTMGHKKIREYQSLHNSNPILEMVAAQESKISGGKSLLQVVRENGGHKRAIGVSSNNAERADFDGDGDYDFQEVCSNDAVYFLSSRALSNNKLRCWYQVNEINYREK